MLSKPQVYHSNFHGGYNAGRAALKLVSYGKLSKLASLTLFSIALENTCRNYYDFWMHIFFRELRESNHAALQSVRSTFKSLHLISLRF